jgi:hypothetical protein
MLFNELLGLRSGPVVYGNTEAVVGDVQREVLAHHGEADETDVGKFFAHVTKKDMELIRPFALGPSRLR